MMRKNILIFPLVGLLTLASLHAQVATPQHDRPTAQQQPQSPLETYRNEQQTLEQETSHKMRRDRRVETRKGNKNTKRNKYSDAVTHYRHALTADGNYHKAQYNLGYAHALLGQNDSALAYYRRTIDNPYATAATRASAHYNSGNIHLRQALNTRDTGGYDAQSLLQAIEEYKAALRLDGSNKDAQYNLSLAKRLLRPEQQQSSKDQQNQNQQDKGQQNKDQQNKDKQDQNQQQGQQQNKDNNNSNKSQQQAQKQRDAEQMLNAVKNNEQQTMRKVQMQQAGRERREGTSRNPEKDW